MKKIIFVLLLVLMVLDFSSCQCDGDQYQIREKIDNNDGTCTYTAHALTPCGTWQDRDKATFTTDCVKYQRSQVISKTEVDKYR